MRLEIASDLGGLRCEFFSKTIKFHIFLYAYGSKRYVPALILDAKEVCISSCCGLFCNTVSGVKSGICRLSRAFDGVPRDFWNVDFQICWCAQYFLHKFHTPPTQIWFAVRPSRCSSAGKVAVLKSWRLPASSSPCCCGFNLLSSISQVWVWTITALPCSHAGKVAVMELWGLPVSS